MSQRKLSSIIIALFLTSWICVSCKTPAILTPSFTPTLGTTPTIASTPTSESTPTSSATEVVTPEKPRYAEMGPYQVGSIDKIIPRDNQDLGITIWYPVLNGAPDTKHGPYPLVVFSPGWTAPGKVYDGLLSPLASYGFVVMAWNPHGEESSNQWAGQGNRPVDTRSVIAYADQSTGPGGEFAGLIDIEHIAIAGHSYGGWTALIGGGAQMTTGWCDANPDFVAKNPDIGCAQLKAHQQEIATLWGLESAPTGMWPPMNDPRVDAVFAWAPDRFMWGAEFEGVAVMQVPILIMIGSEDTYCSPDLCANPIFEHLGSPKKTLVVFQGGDHYLDGVANVNVILHLFIAYLLAELKGDVEAANALLPANFTFPGVEYKTTVLDVKLGARQGLPVVRCVHWISHRQGRGNPHC